MGKVLSIIARPMRDFNLESRAHKIISKDKPVVAPKYKSDQFEYERLMKEYSKTFEDSLKKNDKLDKRLRDVYVTSQDPILRPPQPSSSADRPLPLNRSPIESYEFGFPEPEKVPYGRITLRSAIKLIENHQRNPTDYSVENISEENKIPKETVSNIIKYFKLYEVYVPTERKSKANFAGPAVPRRQVITRKPKELTSGENKDDT